jgi:NAD(P) transhydrogenase subunit beta
MPIIDVDKATNVVVIKRSLSPGFAGIDNPLFYDARTSMLFDDAKRALEHLLASVKSL